MKIGFWGGVVIAFLLFAVLIIGVDVGGENAARECRNLGAFDYDGKVYKCVESKDANK